MNRSMEKIACPHCQAENFATEAVCWQCGLPVTEGHHHTHDQPHPDALHAVLETLPDYSPPPLLIIALLAYCIPVALSIMQIAAVMSPNWAIVGTLTPSQMFNMVFSTLFLAVLYGGGLFAAYFVLNGFAWARRALMVVLIVGILFRSRTFMAYPDIALQWQNLLFVAAGGALLIYLNTREGREYCAS